MKVVGCPWKGGSHRFEDRFGQKDPVLSKYWILIIDHRSSISTRFFQVTLLVLFSGLFQGLSDLHLGDQKVTDGRSWHLVILPSRELTYPPKWHFEDDFPIPKVGYVSSLEGTPISFALCPLPCNPVANEWVKVEIPDELASWEGEQAKWNARSVLFIWEPKIHHIHPKTQIFSGLRRLKTNHSF